jgi:hypothetical protein
VDFFFITNFTDVRLAWGAALASAQLSASVSFWAWKLGSPSRSL